MNSHRDAEITRRYLAGAYGDDLAKEFGLTRVRIGQIVTARATPQELAKRGRLPARWTAEALARRSAACAEGQARRSAAIWPPERLQTLRRMAADGATGSMIAKAIGASRSAVLGKSFRLGIRLTGTNQHPEYRADCGRRAAARRAQRAEMVSS